MIYPFRFPDVGEGITEGQLVKWNVKQGDRVLLDQVLCEIETDKAIVKIPSPKKGIIAKQNGKEGDVIKVGDVLVEIEEEGTLTTDILGHINPPSKERTSQNPAKRTSSTVIGELEEAPEEEPLLPSLLPPPISPTLQILAMPSVRKLARELNIAIETVTGSGHDGRILETDIRQAAKGVQVSVATNLNPSTQESPLPQISLPPPTVERKYDLYGYVERVQLKGFRKVISQHMDESHLKTAGVTHMDEADITLLCEFREREKILYEPKGIKLTYLPFVVKAVITSLRVHPYFNATLDEKTNEIVLKKYYNIGIACDTPEGLMVPIIKNAHQKSILSIAKEISSLALSARDRSINPMDLKGGTFTITNLGSIGGLHFTPIINHPEVAILGMGRLQERVVVKNKTIDVRTILPLSLTFDHRVVDGAEAARFMNEIKEHLENPESLFLEMEF